MSAAVAPRRRAVERLTNRELMTAVVELSGRTYPEFAEDVLGYHESTVRAWFVEPPKHVLDQLRAWYRAGAVPKDAKPQHLNREGNGARRRHGGKPAGHKPLRKGKS